MPVVESGIGFIVHFERNSCHRHCVDPHADVADMVHPSREPGPRMYSKSITCLQAQNPLCLGSVFRVCAPHDLVSEPVTIGNGVSEDLSVLVGRGRRSSVRRLRLTLLACGRNLLCGEPSPAASVVVTGKALIVGVDPEGDFSDWSQHSGGGFWDLAYQKLLGSLVFGDSLDWVESILAGCALVELGVLDYRRNDIAHQLLLQEEHSVVDVVNVACARIHSWFAVCSLVRCFK